MQWWRYLFGIVMLLCLGSWFRVSHALSVDIDNNQVGIYLDFAGSNVTLFGSIDEGKNIAVVVIGPREAMTVYEKVRLFGIWTNTPVARLPTVPGYYYLSMNNRFLLRDIVPDGQSLIKYEVGLENLDVGVSGRMIAKKRLIQVMEEKGLYAEDYRGVKLVDKNLFKVDIPIPRNAPTGVYTVRVLTFGEDGYYSRMRVLPMFIHKRGLIAFISHHARVNALFYGVGIVLGSLLMGILIVVMLRRFK